jgi:tripartite ATP-independent transporter DctP family solute receptor
MSTLHGSPKRFVALLTGAIILVLVLLQTDPGWAQRVELKFAHPFVPTSPQGAIAEVFKQELERRTNNYDVRILPAGQLGGSRDMLEALQVGTIEAFTDGAAIYSLIQPRLTILDLPFLWNDESMWTILDGPLGGELLQSLDSKGIKAVSIGASGWKQLFNSRRPIRRLEDLKGMKIRTIPSQVLLTQFRVWGASPTPVDFKELYTALEGGVVDGQEQPPITVVQMKFYEVQKYMTLTNHGFIHFIQAFNKTWFDRQSTENQKILIDSMQFAALWQRKAIADQTAEAIKQIRARGLQVDELTPEGREEFRQASFKVHEAFTQQIGKEFLDKIYAATKSRTP